MLTSETKRHIDAARQVLVGVVPNPTSQIDQITNALIYKFMDDMDQSAIKAGGSPSFFTGDLEKYAWTRLMDSRLGNQERMNLYAEALVKFSEAKQLPQLFRDIFKSAFLPYRSPEVLGLFLKEIAYFDYSHSEELGNAYEYLLSIMSSQGDAGQFRTPRHIIDFMVDVVSPTKDDKVLDPACGTGGFLVSSYKHILEQHDGKGKDGKPNTEKPLTPDDRKKLIQNFEGYDIDPGMQRIAQVNMYLHQFKNPKIYQYDTLSMDERWNDKFDVILANPPFMSPKGGIKPHSKFSVQSSRSEVLFVDYIMNHLRPKGRAGVIVPEGIIFQSGSAHKQLRKNLVDDGLYAVVSLPSGVFQPYSGVKTSVLLFDNELAKQSTEILFVKVEHDGFDLGATKRPSTKNDLPTALDILRKWKAGEKEEHKLAVYVEKSKIAENGDYNLSGDRYRVATDYSNAKWPMVELGNIVSITTGRKDVNSGNPDGQYPFFTCAKEHTYSDVFSFDAEALLVAGNGVVGDVKYFKGKFEAYQRTYVLTEFKNVLPRYLFVLLKIQLPEYLDRLKLGNTMPYIKVGMLKEFKLPLPPIEVQEQIVAELDGYQKIIDGAKLIAENWKPTIENKPEWHIKNLSDVADFQEGPGIMAADFKEEGVPLLRLKGLSGYYASLDGCNYLDPQKVDEKWKHFQLQVGDLLLSTSGSLGKVSEVGQDLVGSIPYTGIIRFRPKSNEIIPGFLKIFLLSDYFTNQATKASTGVTLKHFGPTHLKKMNIAVPPTEVQQEIVDRISKEREFVESAANLIEIYEKKINASIAKFWEE